MRLEMVFSEVSIELTSSLSFSFATEAISCCIAISFALALSGIGYETLYGHMVRVKVRTGQAVKRGEVIGWVGSTGKSTGPHLHYEVHKGNRPIDPIYFFYNDLTPEQYQQILKLAASGNQSFD